MTLITFMLSVNQIDSVKLLDYTAFLALQYPDGTQASVALGAPAIGDDPAQCALNWDVPGAATAQAGIILATLSFHGADSLVWRTEQFALSVDPA